jgi:hypothetical protein
MIGPGRPIRRRPEDRPEIRERGMTVCVAGIFRWNYATNEKPDYGLAAITVSDRMITLGDVEYEPHQLKVGRITPKIMLMIAGDYTVHSQALRITHDHVGKNPNATPNNVATVYGTAIQAIRRKQAEDIILAPLGLNTDTFLAQQKELSDIFADGIKVQLQNFEGPDVAALIVGMEGEIAHIYDVDRNGTVRCFDDAGFAAIGIGAWHARSRLMQVGYTNFTTYAPALASLYAAKRTAEVAPGVGAKHTDIMLITRYGIEQLVQPTIDKLNELYAEYQTGHGALAEAIIDKLQEFFSGKKSQGDNGKSLSDPDSSTEGRGDTQSASNPTQGLKLVQGKES